MSADGNARKYDDMPRLVRPPAKVRPVLDHDGREIEVILLEPTGQVSARGERLLNIIAHGCVVVQVPPEMPSPKDRRALYQVGFNWVTRDR